MAASGKKKKGKSSKGTTLNLTEFLSSGSGAPAPAPISSSSWADEMADEMDGDIDIESLKLNIDRSGLPTAPRAARGPDVDMSLVPDRPPFTAFLGNLPYDCEEEDIEKFFRELNLLNIRLPSDGGRMKGFGYAEFADKATLLDALAMNEGQMGNRKIRIDLAGSSGGDERGGRDGGRRDDGDDRTAGDWRKAPKTDDGGSRGGDDRYGGDRDRGFGSGRSNDRYGDRGSSSFGDRSGGYGDRDRDQGGRRGFGSGYGDRDGGGSSRYGDSGGSRFGGDRDRGSRAYSPPRDRFGGGGGGGGSSYGGGRDRGYERRDDDGPAPERPRLALAPRSKPVENPPPAPSETIRPAAAAAAARPTERSSNPFGNAKPVDTSRYEETSREERMKDAQRSTGGGADPPPPRRRDDADRGYSRSSGQQQSTNYDAAPAPHHAMNERPRLNLQKRTKPVETTPDPEKSASIFGGAKPVDTAAKEREIEARLAREREMEMEAEHREKRLSSTTDIREQRGSRTRRDSHNSNEDDAPRRTRKLSSSSSGKGIRTVAPPPHVGSAAAGRGRRDSALSDPEDGVFEEEPHSPASSTSSSATKLVPAPAPAENAWAKRKQQQGPSSPPAATAPPHVTPPPAPPAAAAAAEQPAKTHVAAAAVPTVNAWKRGKPEVAAVGEESHSAALPHNVQPRAPAAAAEPSSNAAEQRNIPPPSTNNAWSKGRPSVEAGGASQGRGGAGRGQQAPAPRGGARGSSSGGKMHKPLPQSVEEMPKIDDLQPDKKDFVDSNKFGMLLADEDAGANDSD